MILVSFYSAYLSKDNSRKIKKLQLELKNTLTILNETLNGIEQRWRSLGYASTSIPRYDNILNNLYEGMNLKIKAGKDSHDKRKSEEYNIDVYKFSDIFIKSNKTNCCI